MDPLDDCESKWFQKNRFIGILYKLYIRVRKCLFKIDYAPNLYFAHLLLCQLSNFSKIIEILLKH